MTYSVSAKSSEVIERISYLLENATPTLAPTEYLFVRQDDDSCALEDLTDPYGRVRRFVVEARDPEYGAMFFGDASASYEFLIHIRIGYPKGRWWPIADDETVDGDRYLVEDLIAHDRKLVAQLLENADNWGAIDSLSAISNVQLALLRGEIRESRGKVVAMLYGVQLVETFE